jgi:chromosome segregation ATPase
MTRCVEDRFLASKNGMHDSETQQMFMEWTFTSKKEIVDIISSLAMETADAQVTRYRRLVDQLIQHTVPTPDSLMLDHLKPQLITSTITKLVEEKNAADRANKSLSEELDANQKATDDTIAQHLRARDSEYKSTEDALKKAAQEKREALRKNASQAMELSRAKEEAVEDKLFLAEKRKNLEDEYAEKSRKTDAELLGTKAELADLSLKYKEIQRDLEATIKESELINSKYNKFKEKQLEFKLKAEKVAEENKSLRDEKRDFGNERDILVKERDHYKSISKKSATRHTHLRSRMISTRRSTPRPTPRDQN